MFELVEDILKNFKGSEVVQSDDFETTLLVPGVPGKVRVTATGITMTFNNIIPGSVALDVLSAVATGGLERELVMGLSTILTDVVKANDRYAHYMSGKPENQKERIQAVDDCLVLLKQDLQMVEKTLKQIQGAHKDAHNDPCPFCDSVKCLDGTCRV